MQKSVSRFRRFRLIVYGAAILFFSLIPYSAAEHGVYVCPSAFFGLQCPGCGSTRALVLLLKGRICEAFAMNGVFTSILFPLFFAAVLQDVFVILTGRRRSFLEYLLCGGRK